MKLSVRMRSSRALALAEYFIATAREAVVDINPTAWARAWAGARAAQSLGLGLRRLERV
jgi:hypothetical protein